MNSLHQSFSSIWIVVCGVLLRPGERLSPVYIAALNTETPSRIIQIGIPKLLSCRVPPYPTGPQCLLVTIDANELVGFHLALGWRLPERIVDLAVEFRNSTNGTRRPCGAGLVGALVWFGLAAADGMVRGTSPEAVCRKLTALHRLSEAMQSRLDLGRALLRGRYLAAVARMEWVGVPVDHQMVELLGASWPRLRARVVDLIDRPFKVYERGRFQPAAFQSWLVLRRIQWPHTLSGELDLSDNAFRDMTRVYPELRPLKELRSTLAGFEPSALAIGRDSRNRTPMRPFASRTSRNQPSSKASVWGCAAWVRDLVRPATGRGLALLDWAQQEFGIAAALSGDIAMQAAYLSGDPYMALAVQAGAADSGVRTAHRDIRDRFKACALGVQYGAGPTALARMIGESELTARELLRHHRTAFPAFWRWSDAVESHGFAKGELQSVFGWRVTVDANANPRFLRNFPMQANGAEMLRLACCLVTEAGISICGPQHDALLIEAPLAELDEAIEATRRLMGEASRVVLNDFALRTDVKVVRHPDRYRDTRGTAIWQAIEEALSEDAERRPLRKVSSRPAHPRNGTCSEANSRSIYLFGSKEEDTDASD